jgi:DNA-binding NarL/FixJ family response regulator
MITIPPYPIFLVEDNRLYLNSLEQYLKANLKFNVQMHTFLSGEDCLKQMHLKPRIIILDYLLNSRSKDAANGLDILKQIDKVFSEVAVVILSGQDELKVATDSLKYGAYDYVPKNDGAFLRIHNIINNLHKMIVQAAELKATRKVKHILIGCIALLIGAAVICRLFLPEYSKWN